MKPIIHQTSTADLRAENRIVKGGQMRDVDTTDSELQLVAVLRRAARERGGPLPSMAVADALLEERREQSHRGRTSRLRKGCSGTRRQHSPWIAMGSFPDDLDAVADAFDTAADALRTVAAFKPVVMAGNTT